MRISQLFLFCFFLLQTSKLFSQADLVATAADFTPTNLLKGDLITAVVTIKNKGNQPSGANYVTFYFSKDLSISTDEEPASRVSLKSLAMGASAEVVFFYPIPATLTSGNYYLLFQIDPYNSVVENDENNNFCAGPNGCKTFFVESLRKFNSLIPCPIIFVHGLISNDKTWIPFKDEIRRMYGWIDGGRLDYCLNFDKNQSTADGCSTIIDHTNSGSIYPGDFYSVNFDIAKDGTLYVNNLNIFVDDDQSNQSAVVKQGCALKKAIKRVLELTGAENVILVGHSMGGLAIREYLQNSNNYQNDGKHHVSKILTLATPHGGTNYLTSAPGVNLGLLDAKSEAIRDLRYPNLDFLFDGVYLFGGQESLLYPNFYHNSDVNCDGDENDVIVGLNEKYSPVDLNYACIIGNDDKFVEKERADLNQVIFPQPPLFIGPTDRFYVNSGHSIQEDKKNFSVFVQGLDEPTYYETAYSLRTNTGWFANVTQQAPNNPLPAPQNTIDYDDFKVNIPSTGTWKISVYDIPVNTFACYVLNSAYQQLKKVSSNGADQLELELNVSAGTYYIEFEATPTTESWRFPYVFFNEFTPTSNLVANFSADNQSGCSPLTVYFSNLSSGSPATYQWSFSGGTPATSNQQNPIIKFNQPGVYNVSLTISKNGNSVSKTESGFIVVGKAPEANFSYSYVNNNTVQFFNTSANTAISTNYVWTFGDFQNSSEESPTHQYLTAGTFKVRLVATNNCGSNTIEKYISTLVADKEIAENEKIFKVYPNPNNGSFTVFLNADLKKTDGKIVVLDAMGREIQSHGLNAETEIEIYDKTGGVYFVGIKTPEFVLFKRVVIQN